MPTLYKHILRIIFFTFLFAYPIVVSHSASLTMKGFAWSDTIGWISLSCEDGGSGQTNICGTSEYKVYVANDKTLSGYGWSDSLGWISFNETSGCPVNPCQAKIDGTTITGWARVLSVAEGTPSLHGNWDGWITLGEQGGYGGITLATTTTGWDVTGYAWTDLVAGWISFLNVEIGCESGFLWSFLQSICVDAPLATISATPTNVNYGSRSTLTWSGTNADSCTALGAWSNGGNLSGSGLTDPLTSSQNFQYYCSAQDVNSPIASTLVTVCPQESPAWYNNTCNPGSRVISTEVKGQYTPNGRLDVVCSNADFFTIKKDGDDFQTIQGTSGSIDLTTSGIYTVTCFVITDQGNYPSTQAIVEYLTTPPPPIAQLKVSPTTIAGESEVVITWDITFPGAVQVPPRTCTLSASAVCANGNCTQEQLDAVSTLNQALAGRTDSNDTGGANRLISTAINTVVNGNVTTGETDWRAFGKKTVTVTKVTDISLRCGVNSTEFKTVRVKVTASSEN